MLRRFAHFLIVTALVLSIGLHWMVLQSAAWVGMVVSYTQETGALSTALEQTFDGDHPCKLCAAVSEGVNQADEPADSDKCLLKKVDKRIDLMVADSRLIFRALSRRMPIEDWNESGVSRADVPPTGPPRLMA